MTHRNIRPFMGDTASETGLEITAEHMQANPLQTQGVDYGPPRADFSAIVRHHPKYTPVVPHCPAANTASGEYILYGAGLATLVAGVAGVLREGNRLPLPGNPTPAEYGVGLLLGGAALVVAGLQYSRLQRMSDRIEGFVAENTRIALEGLRASRPIDRSAVVQMREDIIDRARKDSYGR
jgi:hypothetical protein